VQVLESSREKDEPLSFEIGAGEVTGNPLFKVNSSSCCRSRPPLARLWGSTAVSHLMVTPQRRVVSTACTTTQQWLILSS